MTPEEFRAAGHELIDWIADYRQSIDERRVAPDVQPGEIAAMLPSIPPAEIDDFGTLLADLDRVVAPGVLNVHHPMHFGWFPSNAALASVLGDIASSGIGSLGISWESSPALTEVEQVVVDWMRQLVGLSGAWQGGIQDTASTAALVSMLVARERASQQSLFAGGLQGEPEPLVVYTTIHAHSSIQKAALLAGFGADNVRVVSAAGPHNGMDPAALAEAIADDLAGGRRPAAVVASVGSTGVTAIDPVAAIVAEAARHDVWVHVDAAMAGSAMLLPECRWMWEGVEGADAVSLNPHKWMGTILDCSLLYVRDVEFMEQVLSTNPAYLQSHADGSARQYRDWGIPLGRRFRALKLWFHLRLDGVEAIQARLRRESMRDASGPTATKLTACSQKKSPQRAGFFRASCCKP